MPVIHTLFRRVLFVGALVVPFACSSKDDDGSDELAEDGSGGSSNGSTSAASGNTATGTTGGIDIGDDPDVIDVNGEPCAADVTQAELVDIDIHLMLDSSGSMLDLLPNGDTKWDAVVDSLVDFVQDPGTADIGVGLNYFPKLRENAVLECFTNSDCAAGSGPCGNSACVFEGSVQGDDYLALTPTTTEGVCDGDSFCGGDERCITLFGLCVYEDQALTATGDDLLVCETTSDCPLGTCEELGFCEYLDADGLPVTCTSSLACPQGTGQCVSVPSSCENATLCGGDDYATPAVEISAAGDRAALVTSLTSHEPEGLTPTAPALAGAIQHAQERELADPTRKVVAVLATDGFPTECDPAEIDEVASIAQAGVQGTPSVETYVIGVFSAAQEQEARANLNQIAAAGGTQEAFIITTGNDVATLFLEALNEIRGAALTCDFAIPEAQNGEQLDFGQVNLEFIDSEGESRQLVNVSDESACADTSGTGWYYVRDPDSDQPTQITVCPDVCDEFQSAMGASQVNLQIGCATIIK